MKKGIMLNFLFWTILALLIFIPTVLWASQFLRLSNKQEQSFNNLAGTIDSPETPFRDGEIQSTSFYLDDKSLIAGFAKTSSTFELHNYYPKNPNSDQIGFRFKRPNLDNCPIQKACICLCKDYVSLQEPSAEPPECAKPLCKSFDKLDFLSEKVTEKEKDGSTKSGFKGGFLYYRSKDNPIQQISVATKTLYVEKYKNFIDVCLSYPCFTPEIKERINKEEAISLFNSFIKKYEECKSKADGQCETLSTSLHGQFYIYYKNSNENSKSGFYLMKGEFAKSFNEMEIVKGKDGKENFYSAMLYKDENNEYDTGSIFTGPEIKFIVKNSRIILSVAGTFDINLPNE